MTAREAAGVVALACAWLVVGQALLAGAGIVRSRAAAVRAAGLALVAGWAASGVVLAFALMAGAALGMPLVAAAWVGLAAAGAAAARAVSPLRRAEAPRRPRSWPGIAGAAVLAAYLCALLARSLVPSGDLHPDAWTQWLLKAKVIYFLGGLDSGAGGLTHQANPDYPPLDPVQEATAFHVLGRADPLALPLLHWILFAAFLGALAFLLRPRTSPALLWPSLAMLALAPRLTALVGSSLADEPLALLIALAGVAGTLWLREREARWAALACVFLAAAALTKNEGLMLGLVLAATLAVAARRRGGLALLAAPLVGWLPWKLWLHVHAVPTNFGYDFGRIVHPGTLAADRAYLWYGARSLLESLFSPRQWLLIVPAALALGVLAARRRRPLAVLGLAFPLVVLLGFSAIYWLGNGICTWEPGTVCNGSWHDVEWLVGSSADRIVASVAVLLAAVFPLLAADAGA